VKIPIRIPAAGSILQVSGKFTFHPGRNLDLRFLLLQ